LLLIGVLGTTTDGTTTSSTGKLVVYTFDALYNY
jgi:hypothetical protein